MKNTEMRNSSFNKDNGMAENFWNKRRVIVTGGSGFLGSFVVEKLRQRGAQEVFVPRSSEHDLRRAD